MAYINKGDKLIAHGKNAIATSDDYTKMVYDDEDYFLGHRGYEAGTAMGYVNVRYEDGFNGSVPIKFCSRVS